MSYGHGVSIVNNNNGTYSVMARGFVILTTCILERALQTAQAEYNTAIEDE